MYKKEEYILRKSIGEELFNLFSKHNCVLAGGTITSIFSGNRINDYDIYFHKEEDLNSLTSELETTNFRRDNILERATILYKTENASTYSIDSKTIQLIRLENLIAPGTKTIIEQFDFTVCMGAYDFADKCFTLDENFLKHLAQRTLVYNTNSKYPFVSLCRVVKYIKKGFKISGIEMLKLGLKCNSLPIHNFRDLRRQLMGIDTLFLKDLTDKLSSEEMAEKQYDFDLFLQMMEEHLSKFEEFNTEEHEK